MCTKCTSMSYRGSTSITEYFSRNSETCTSISAMNRLFVFIRLHLFPKSLRYNLSQKNGHSNFQTDSVVTLLGKILLLYMLKMLRSNIGCYYTCLI